jgi:hypothetical protein
LCCDESERSPPRRVGWRGFRRRCATSGMARSWRADGSCAGGLGQPQQARPHRCRFKFREPAGRTRGLQSFADHGCRRLGVLWTSPRCRCRWRRLSTTLPRPSLSSLADSSREDSADGVTDHPELLGDRPLQAPFAVEDVMCLGSVSHLAHRAFSGQLTKESKKHRADTQNTRFAAGSRRSDLVLSGGRVSVSRREHRCGCFMRLASYASAVSRGGLDSDASLHCMTCGSSRTRNSSDGMAVVRRAREHAGNCTLNDGWEGLPHPRELGCGTSRGLH